MQFLSAAGDEHQLAPTVQSLGAESAEAPHAMTEHPIDESGQPRRRSPIAEGTDQSRLAPKWPGLLSMALVFHTSTPTLRAEVPADDRRCSAALVLSNALDAQNRSPRLSLPPEHGTFFGGHRQGQRRSLRALVPNDKPRRAVANLRPQRSSAAATCAPMCPPPHGFDAHQDRFQDMGLRLKKTAGASMKRFPLGPTAQGTMKTWRGDQADPAVCEKCGAQDRELCRARRGRRAAAVLPARVNLPSKPSAAAMHESPRETR